MTEPHWQNVKFPKIDYQTISYYAAPKPKNKLASMDEVDPELLRTFEKLGVPMHERAALAGVDAGQALRGYMAEGVTQDMGDLLEQLRLGGSGDTATAMAKNYERLTSGLLDLL